MLADVIALGALPLSVAEDPLTDTTYVGEKGKGSSFSTAVINDHDDKVVARLPVFGYNFAFDSRTDAFYLPTKGGVAIIAGRTHRVIKKLPVAAFDATVDPRTGHVFLAVQKGTSSSILVLSDRTNKIIARVGLPASARLGPMAASPVTGVIYVGISPPRQASAVWVIGTRSARVLARIGIGDDLGAFGVDPQNNLLGVLAQDT